MSAIEFNLPRDVTRIWELEVPVFTDHANKAVYAYLTGVIDEPCLYNELCYTIKTLPEDYTANIFINTPGGVIDSAFMIAAAMDDCKGKIVGHLSGTVASAGTVIVMKCDEVVVTPHISFMIHNYSGDLRGKGHEMKARQKFVDEHLNDAFRQLYLGFLTEQEISDVIGGSDLWMNSTEVRQRLDSRSKTLSEVE